MKHIFKKFIVAILKNQIIRLQKKNDFRVVAVVGSYGKTSTKFAVAELLQNKFKVPFQEGNYNDIVTVPLVFFGHDIPSLFNPLAWAKVILKNEQQLRKLYPYDVVVLELGIDGPGQMKEFDYLQIDLAVVTSIGPEHMEYFTDVHQVAHEELSVSLFSTTVIINGGLCDKKYFSVIKNATPYTATPVTAKSSTNWKLTYGKTNFTIPIDYKNQTRMYSLSSAFIVGLSLGMHEKDIIKYLAYIGNVPGRMNLLRGIQGAVIIDDTYNSSPEAALIALQTLYDYPAQQRIALLGNMNELGKHSDVHHKALGNACDPKKLDLLVTLGPDANAITAPAALESGCTVYKAKDAKDAAKHIKKELKAGAVILAKGSQNLVYAEEAVKLMLADERDRTKLVRQSNDWLKKKNVKA